MSAYKDKTQGTWYVSFRYIDWTGKKTQKLKRGFKTKKEALNYEKEFIRKTAADMKMEMNSFIQVYFEDKKNELKENSIRNKQHMMNKHIVPYFGRCQRPLWRAGWQPCDGQPDERCCRHRAGPMNVKKQFFDGLINQNPSLVQLLGMCPLLAITTSRYLR